MRHQRVIVALGALCAMSACSTYHAPPIVTPPPATRTVAVTVVQPDRSAVPHLGEPGTCAILIDTMTPIPCTYHDYQAFFEVPIGEVGYGATVELRVPGFGTIQTARFVASAGLPEQTMRPMATAPAARRGLVRGNGQQYVDDDGAYRPLGDTLLWALYGWHTGDRDRVVANWRFLKAHGSDYIRVLAQVGWTGEEIDPDWPDYVPTLASMLDAAYADGLRTKITLIGGGARDPIDAARKVCQAVSGRQYKVQALETANEANLSRDQIAPVTAVLLTCGVPLVSVGMGDQGVDAINEYTGKAGATKADLHTERTATENGARQVRQAWDFRYLAPGKPKANAEPPGPASSVAELTDPFKLGAFRTLSIMLGAGDFTRHTGHGVYGRPDPVRNRTANIFDAPGIGAVLDALDVAGEWLPDAIENWTPNNEKYKSTAYVEGAINKCYGAEAGDGRFLYMAIGVEGASTITAQKAVTLRVRHPVTGDILSTYDMVAGQRIAGPALWAYVIDGATR